MTMVKLDLFKSLICWVVSRKFDSFITSSSLTDFHTQYCHTQQYICNTVIIEDYITPQTRINFSIQKLTS